MNLFKKIISLIFVIAMAFSFSGCNDNKADESKSGVSTLGSHDNLEIDDYYLLLVNEVKNGSVLSEQNYYLTLDSELTQMKGTLNVKYYEDGRISSYEAVIGVLYTERMIIFSKGDYASNYSDMYFSQDGKTLHASYENVYVDPETGVSTNYVGTVDYYESGNEKAVHEEQYVSEGNDQRLVCTIEREFNKDGSLKSEKIVNEE